LAENASGPFMAHAPKFKKTFAWFMPPKHHHHVYSQEQKPVRFLRAERFLFCNQKKEFFFDTRGQKPQTNPPPASARHQPFFDSVISHLDPSSKKIRFS